MSSETISPKLFISYSWTTPDHEAWVIQFATKLSESGIDVILDKWDLKEGHDSYAFMEKMVADPEINKVLLICDKGYVDKADDRSGGVGTETQIITPEIYNKQAQDKFVAVVKERDENGKPYIPAFYGSRIFIDLSDPRTYSENFTQLLRWVFDQPLHRKPPIGKKPAFLSEENGAVEFATSIKYESGDESKFEEAEVAMLRIFYYDSESDRSLREKSRLKIKMQELGFSQPDITDAFNKLELEGMIHFSSGNYIDKTYNYSLTQKGVRWCLDNKERLKGSG